MDCKAELIFIPSPGAGHLVATLEIAKLLVARDHRLSISVLVLKFPFDTGSPSAAEPLSSGRIKFVDVPRDDDPSLATFTPQNFLHFYEAQKPHVRAAVQTIISESGSTRIAGFVMDMFCTAMIDVADELGIPSYVFFTSNAAFLCLAFRMNGLGLVGFDKDRPGPDLDVPGFSNPVPEKVIPSVFFSNPMAELFINRLIGRIRRSKGVLVNSLAELEGSMIEALSCWDADRLPLPPIYPVGPLINLSPEENHAAFIGDRGDKKTEIVAWLDSQPRSSVVFLCFGSMGSFEADQVREIARALELSKVRFLWSLRQRPQNDNDNNTNNKKTVPIPIEYADLDQVLPEGFLNRTAELGKIIGWAPQVTVLAHPAVGGFVSHCGWNSTLESLWFGVPMATWPLYAEQQMNALEMVRELGLAAEIRIDYKRDHVNGGGDSQLVKAEEIERGIRKLMESESEIRKRVKDMSDKSRRTVIEGGSSYASLSRFINEVFENIA